MKTKYSWLQFCCITSIILIFSISSHRHGRIRSILWEVKAFESPTSGLNNNPSPSPTTINHHASITDAINDFVELSETFMKSALAGKILPITSRIWTIKTKYKDIVSALRNLAKPSELVFLILLGWLTIPAIQYPYERILNGTSTSSTGISTSMRRADAFMHMKETDSDTSTSTGTFERSPARIQFKDSILYLVADYISRAAKIAVLVYVIDCIAVILKTLGFDVKNYSQVLAKVIYTTWFFDRIKVAKKYLIFKTLNVLDSRRAKRFQPGAFGRATILDRLLDAVIIAAMTLSILDVLQVEGGLALKSFFAFGSAGTLLFSFASKDLATQLVSGLAMSSSDKVYEGEEVSFGDGTKGVIVNMGWMQTLIRSADEMITSIPNTHLANQRITNISRIRKCQVKQVLRFDYEDADKFPSLFESIKKEIRSSCPRVIVDGSRPFRVVWSDFKNTHLEVTVDVHFNIKPSGDVYHENRQQCLMAIYRAVKNNGMKFVVQQHEFS